MFLKDTVFVRYSLLTLPCIVYETAGAAALSGTALVGPMLQGCPVQQSARLGNRTQDNQSESR
jgi:hypothetical protein